MPELFKLLFGFEEDEARCVKWVVNAEIRAVRIADKAPRYKQNILRGVHCFLGEACAAMAGQWRIFRGSSSLVPSRLKNSLPRDFLGDSKLEELLKFTIDLSRNEVMLSASWAKPSWPWLDSGASSGGRPPLRPLASRTACLGTSWATASLKNC